VKKMHCSERDQDILLLQHDELSGWRRLATLHHLRSCPRCQEQYDQYSRVGRDIAGAIRQSGGLPPFHFPPTPTLARVTPAFAETKRPVFRPVFIAATAALAAAVAASAYVYKAMALTPAPEEANASYRVIESRSGTPNRTPHNLWRAQCVHGSATDSRGLPTIFPYSTPVLDNHRDTAVRQTP